MTLHASSVYVNAASTRLEAASRNGDTSLEIREGKRWVTGRALLVDARRSGAELPLIFAHYAELTYWALARAIEVDETGTTYTFSNLTPITAGFRRNDLTVKSSGARLPDDFIRSYAIVETPPFLAPARTTSPRVSGKRLAKLWKVDVLHALYSETGDWYHQLKRFPGGLFDANGYVVFQSKQDFISSHFLEINQDVAVRDGIKGIPEYVRVLTSSDDADDNSVIDETLALVRPRGAASQGWQGSAERRTAIELHAMRLAQAHYSAHWALVTDVSRTHSYDLECQDGDRRLMVEVKGTTSTGHAVLLTRNEVRLAQKNPTAMALFVVSNIRIDAKGVPHGGDVRRYEPWNIDENELEPMVFKCQLRRP